ncbi:MAG: ABC transporter ATP-binding protein [Firmicutes bacterium]|nr:ABC transporter ATP-binding protein [Bacillota bacterium]
MENSLEIINLRKKYGEFGVEDVSFNLPKGHIMGFVGKNGAGKTTTIKSILNMVKKDSGQIKIFGLDHLNFEAEIKQKIGVVMDSPFFEENWTLVQTGKALKPFYPNWSDKKFAKMLNDFGLVPSKKIKELSRGMKMKIMIACAIAHDPDLLILDEPTGGLDAVARDELLQILKDFISSQNKSILFSTHISADLEKIADYITFIDDGKTIHSDTKDNLLKKYITIKGDTSTLSQQQKRLIIGYTQSTAGFEGIINKNDLPSFSNQISTDQCTLDEIVVRFNKGGAK